MYLGIFNSFDSGTTHGVHWALRTSNTRTYASLGSIPRNEWVHLVGTYDGSRLKAYVNGSLVSDIALTGTINDGSYGIGHYLPAPTDGTHNFDGEIAVVKIYNRALSDAEVLGNFEATRWRFGV